MNLTNKTINKIVFYTTISVLMVLFNFGFALAATSDQIINLTNTERTQNSLNTLTANGDLAQAAQAKAQDMFKDGYFAHISPDGTTPWDFIKGAGYEYSYAGENLAIGYDNGAELVNAWMNSPLHRANILNEKFSEIGVAVVNGNYNGENTDIVVQMFGTPLALVNNNTNENTNVNNITANVEGVEDTTLEDQPAPEATVSVEVVAPVTEVVTPTPSVIVTPSVSVSAVLTENENTNNQEQHLDTNKIIIISSIGAGLVLLVTIYLVMRYQNSNKIA